jgi:hypothetical protein
VFARLRDVAADLDGHDASRVLWALSIAKVQVPEPVLQAMWKATVRVAARVSEKQLVGALKGVELLQD